MATKKLQPPVANTPVPPIPVPSIPPIPGLQPVTPTTTTTVPLSTPQTTTSSKGKLVPSNKGKTRLGTVSFEQLPGDVPTRLKTEAKAAFGLILNAPLGLANFLVGGGIDFGKSALDVGSKLIPGVDFEAGKLKTTEGLIESVKGTYTLADRLFSSGDAQSFIEKTRPPGAYGDLFGKPIATLPDRYVAALEANQSILPFIVEDFGNISMAGGLYAGLAKQGVRGVTLGEAAAQAERAAAAKLLDDAVPGTAEAAAAAERVAKAEAKIAKIQRTKEFLQKNYNAGKKLERLANKVGAAPFKPYGYGTRKLLGLYRDGIYLGPNGRYARWGAKASEAYKQQAFKLMDEGVPADDPRVVTLIEKSQKSGRRSIARQIQQSLKESHRDAANEQGSAMRAVVNQIQEPLHKDVVNPETGQPYGELSLDEVAAILAIQGGTAQIINRLSLRYNIPPKILALLGRYDFYQEYSLSERAAEMARDFLNFSPETPGRMTIEQYERLANAAENVAKTVFRNMTERALQGYGRRNPMPVEQLVPTPFVEGLKRNIIESIRQAEKAIKKELAKKKPDTTEVNRLRMVLADRENVLESWTAVEESGILELPVDHPDRIAVLKGFVDQLPIELALDPTMYSASMRVPVEYYRRIRRAMARSILGDGGVEVVPEDGGPKPKPAPARAAKEGAVEAELAKRQGKVKAIEAKIERVVQEIDRKEAQHAKLVERIVRYDIVDAYISGKSVEQVATEFELDPKLVEDVIKNSPPAKTYRRAQELKKAVDELRAQFTPEQLAAMPEIMAEAQRIIDEANAAQAEYQNVLRLAEEERQQIEAEADRLNDDLDVLEDEMADYEDTYEAEGGIVDDLWDRDATPDIDLSGAKDVDKVLDDVFKKNNNVFPARIKINKKESNANFPKAVIESRVDPKTGNTYEVELTARYDDAGNYVEPYGVSFIAKIEFGDEGTRDAIELDLIQSKSTQNDVEELFGLIQDAREVIQQTPENLGAARYSMLYDNLSLPRVPEDLNIDQIESLLDGLDFVENKLREYIGLPPAPKSKSPRGEKIPVARFGPIVKNVFKEVAKDQPSAKGLEVLDENGYWSTITLKVPGSKSMHMDIRIASDIQIKISKRQFINEVNKAIEDFREAYAKVLSGEETSFSTGTGGVLISMFIWAEDAKVKDRLGTFAKADVESLISTFRGIADQIIERMPDDAPSKPALKPVEKPALKPAEKPALAAPKPAAKSNFVTPESVFDQQIQRLGDSLPDKYPEGKFDYFENRALGSHVKEYVYGDVVVDVNLGATYIGVVPEKNTTGIVFSSSLGGVEVYVETDYQENKFEKAIEYLTNIRDDLKNGKLTAFTEHDGPGVTIDYDLDSVTVEHFDAVIKSITDVATGGLDKPGPTPTLTPVQPSGTTEFTVKSALDLVNEVMMDSKNYDTGLFMFISKYLHAIPRKLDPATIAKDQKKYVLDMVKNGQPFFISDDGAYYSDGFIILPYTGAVREALSPLVSGPGRYEYKGPRNRKPTKEQIVFQSSDGVVDKLVKNVMSADKNPITLVYRYKGESVYRNDATGELIFLDEDSLHNFGPYKELYQIVREGGNAKTAPVVVEFALKQFDEKVAGIIQPKKGSTQGLGENPPTPIERLENLVSVLRSEKKIGKTSYYELQRIADRIYNKIADIESTTPIAAPDVTPARPALSPVEQPVVSPGPGKAVRLPVAPDGRNARADYVVIPCGAAKASEPTTVENMYQGSMFKDALATARQLFTDDRILVLSAKYGLMSLDDFIEPYDVKLGDPGSISSDYLVPDISDKIVVPGSFDNAPLASVMSLLPNDYHKLLNEGLAATSDYILQSSNGVGKYSFYLEQVFEGSKGIGEQKGRLKQLREESPVPAEAKPKATKPSEVVPDPQIKDPVVREAVYTKEVIDSMAAEAAAKMDAAETVKAKLAAFQEFVDLSKKYDAEVARMAIELEPARNARAKKLKVEEKIKELREIMGELPAEKAAAESSVEAMLSNPFLEPYLSMTGSMPLEAALAGDFPSEIGGFEAVGPDGENVRLIGPMYYPSATPKEFFGAVQKETTRLGFRGFKKLSSEHYRDGDRQVIFSLRQVAIRMGMQVAQMILNERFRAVVAEFGIKASNILGEEYVESLYQQATQWADNMPQDALYTEFRAKMAESLGQEPPIPGIASPGPGVKNPARVREFAINFRFGQLLGKAMQERGFDPIDPYASIEKIIPAENITASRAKAMEETQIDLQELAPEEITSETLFLPSGLKEKMVEVIAVKNSNRFQTMLQGAQKVTSFFKVGTLVFSIPWQVGDLVSSIIVSTMSGVDPRVLIRYMKEIKVQEYGTGRAGLRRMVDPYIDQSGKSKLTLRRLIDPEAVTDVGQFRRGPLARLASESGVQNLGQTMQERAYLYGEDLQPKRGFVDRISGGRLKFVSDAAAAVTGFSFKVNETINKITRHAFFLEQLDQQLRARGQTLESIKNVEDWQGDAEIKQAVFDAARSANQWLGDYANLSLTERRYITSVFPFWAWIRHIHSVFDLVAVDNPEALFYYMYIGTLATEDEEDPLNLRRGGFNVFGGVASSNWLNPFADVVDGPIAAALIDQDLRPAGSMFGPVPRLLGGAVGIDVSRPGSPISRPAGTGGYSETGQRTSGSVLPLLGGSVGETIGFTAQQFPIAQRILNINPTPFENIPGTRVALGQVARYQTGEARLSPTTGQRIQQPGGRTAALLRLFGGPLVPYRTDEQINDVLNAARQRLLTLDELQRIRELQGAP